VKLKGIRMKRLLIGVVIALGALAPFASASAQEAPAQIRVAHFSPDAPGVDVYLDGQQAVGNMGFETVTDYLAVPPGDHLIELRPSGAAPTSTPVWSGNATLESGQYYTAAGLGPLSQLSAELFTDDIAMPPAGSANVRFIHAAVGAGDVNVAFGGSPLEFTDAAFATPTAYSTVDPGQYDVSLEDESGTALVGSQIVEFTAGVNYTVVAIGGQGSPLRLLAVVDTRAAADAPAGAPATGGGGLATRSHSDNGLLLALPVVVLVGAIATGVWKRGRRAAA
jgi:hypothetical protein